MVESRFDPGAYLICCDHVLYSVWICDYVRRIGTVESSDYGKIRLIP
jgi:hypothetical protein